MIRIEHLETEHGSWEVALGVPTEALRGYTYGRYQGYVERTAAPLRRREVPSGRAPLVFNLGPPFREVDPQHPTAVTRPMGTFLAGLHHRHALIETCGVSSGIQVDLTPIGARLLVGESMSALTNRVIELNQLLGPEADALTDRLREAPDWRARFILLDQVLSRRIAAAAPAPRGVVEAWRGLIAAGGTLRIRKLAEDIGWSSKHLIARFREYVGLPPKLFERVIRFNRARRLLNSWGPRVSWGDIAYRCGYADQAHLIRDFRRFAGESPRRFLQRCLPGGVGVEG